MGSVVADAESTRSAPVLRRPVRLILAVAVATIALDQLSKWWAVETLSDPTRTIDVFWTLRLRLVHNTGTAFSLTSDSGPFVTVIAVGVIGYLVVTGRRLRSPVVTACYGLIVGGTLGNVVDRIFRDGDGVLGGPVIDFVEAADWFPVFNLADAALVVGIGLLLLVGFVDPDVLESADSP